MDMTRSESKETKDGDLNCLTIKYLVCFPPCLKAMVFLVVMYGCESWTVKKAEHQRIYTFELCVGEDS